MFVNICSKNDNFDDKYFFLVELQNQFKMLTNAGLLALLIMSPASSLRKRASIAIFNTCPVAQFVSKNEVNCVTYRQTITGHQMRDSKKDLQICLELGQNVYTKIY